MFTKPTFENFGIYAIQLVWHIPNTGKIRTKSLFF